MDSALRRSAALAALRERWGNAAPRPAIEVFGALAVAPVESAEGDPATAWGRPADALFMPAGGNGVVAPGRPALAPVGDPLAAPVAPAVPSAHPLPAPDATGRVVSTGFAELDALLGPGGLPRPGSVAFAGAGSAGTTTLALRAVASAQTAGAIAAWVDGSRSLDPVEAVARGVRLEWLVVLVPRDPVEGLEMAGTLLQSRAVDVLVLDPGDGRADPGDGRTPGRNPTRPRARAPAGDGARRPSAATRRPSDADRLDRLLALARRAEALLLVLEPAELPASLHGVLDGVGLRLELRRRDWIRLGHEVVGQRAEVRVARDHHGSPDRRTELRILYAEGGARDRCLRLPHLLDEASLDAPAPSRLATPPRPPGVLARSRAPDRRADRRRRTAVG